MTERTVHWFSYSAGILLSATALAKLIASARNGGSLYTIDPILLISFQNLFWTVGLIELVVALVCFMARSHLLKGVLLAWLASSFMIYRLGLLAIGYRLPCPCLGDLTSAIGISPKSADYWTKAILIYLMIGSYCTLYWLLRRRRIASF